MRETSQILKALSNNSKMLTPHKSFVRQALERNAKIFLAPLAIFSAGILLFDGIATWKANMR